MVVQELSGKQSVQGDGNVSVCFSFSELGMKPCPASAGGPSATKLGPSSLDCVFWYDFSVSVNMEKDWQMVTGLALLMREQRKQQSLL